MTFIYCSQASSAMRAGIYGRQSGWKSAIHLHPPYIAINRTPSPYRPAIQPAVVDSESPNPSGRYILCISVQSSMQYICEVVIYHIDDTCTGYIWPNRIEGNDTIPIEQAFCFATSLLFLFGMQQKYTGSPVIAILQIYTSIECGFTRVSIGNHDKS